MPISINTHVFQGQSVKTFRPGKFYLSNLMIMPLSQVTMYVGTLRGGNEL